MTADSVEPGLLIAHTPNESGEWHLLIDHLVKVGERASRFGAKFGSSEMCRVAGLLHDAGKAQPAFQQYLRAQHAGQPGASVPHAVWGAVAVWKLLGQHSSWPSLALPIRGHHGSLLGSALLESDLIDAHANSPSTLTAIGPVLGQLSFPKWTVASSSDAFAREMQTRLIYSALVDADRLDTESHFSPLKTAQRESRHLIADLLNRFEADHRTRFARPSVEDTVSRVRHQVFDACWTAGVGQQGIYRLTVPTGGGKTLSALAFALRHAHCHGLDRVIVALPYTSITDQTADEYRKALGDDAVLEHHSRVEESEGEGQSEAAIRLRNATENWQHPIIVTTTVQLFESLFSNRASRVRKIHNIARSVVILDEVQTLPSQLLKATLNALRFLVEHCDVTVLLSTATQPAFAECSAIEEFRGMTIPEIVPDFIEHFKLLRRVNYVYDTTPVTWSDLAQTIANSPQAMTIVNTRRDALALYREMDEGDSLFHLSSLLCTAHRRKSLECIKERLKNHEPVQLVSTQVVEAGVDISFPRVYRAIGPLDRIIQAAGRCNRGGEFDGGGTVTIFEPEGGAVPRGAYVTGLIHAREILSHRDPNDLHDPAVIDKYFRDLYSAVPLDKERVQASRQELDYPTVARKYRMISDDTVPVVVPYDSGRDSGLKALRAWRRQPSRATWQRLQSFVVNVYRDEAQHLIADGWLSEVSEVSEGLYLCDATAYNSDLGLIGASLSAEDLVI